LLNCCRFLLPVRRRLCQRCGGTEQASDPSRRFGFVWWPSRIAAYYANLRDHTPLSLAVGLPPPRAQKRKSRQHTQCASACAAARFPLKARPQTVSSGRDRYLFPVSRANAFTTAGEVTGVAGSPTPKGASSLGTICTSIAAGISDM
jgi:hypothetical protein